MINALEHVAISVGNIERSLAFYRDFIGMEVIMDLNITDDRIGRVVGIPEARCRIVHLRLGQTVLELFCYTNPAGTNKADAMRQCDHGLIHIGFKVTDFHGEVERLKAGGFTFLGEPVEFRPGVWIVYFRGPDGEICEFRQT